MKWSFGILYGEHKNKRCHTRPVSPQRPVCTQPHLMECEPHMASIPLSLSFAFLVSFSSTANLPPFHPSTPPSPTADQAPHPSMNDPRIAWGRRKEGYDEQRSGSRKARAGVNEGGCPSNALSAELTICNSCSTVHVKGVTFCPYLTRYGMDKNSWCGNRRCNQRISARLSHSPRRSIVRRSQGFAMICSYSKRLRKLGLSWTIVIGQNCHLQGHCPNSLFFFLGSYRPRIALQCML